MHKPTEKGKPDKPESEHDHDHGHGNDMLPQHGHGGSGGGKGNNSSPKPRTIIITGPFPVLNIGQTEQLAAVIEDQKGNPIQGLLPDSWVSSNPLIIRVDAAGFITAISVGTANITAGYGTLVSTPLPITAASNVPAPDNTPALVVASPSSISQASPASPTQLTAIVKNAEGVILSTTPTWSSSDTSVAQVSSNGFVVYVSPGTATILAHAGSIDSNPVTVTYAAIITPPPDDGIVLVQSDFSSGNFQPEFWNPWGTGIDVVDSPFTGDGKGKVARIHYQLDATGQFDDNKGLFCVNVPTLKLGEDGHFQGEFRLDPTARMDASGPSLVQRKLFYWGGDNPSNGGVAYLQFILTTFGPQFSMVTLPFQDWGIAAGTESSEYIDTAIAVINNTQWNKLRFHIRINSTFDLKDGAIEAWLNGVKFIDHPTGASFTIPSEWAGHTPAEFSFGMTNFGYQADSSVAVDEYRYWDNVAWATTKEALPFPL